MAIFDLCFEKVIHFEGGYRLHNVPGDRGGMTYAGISRNAWPDWPGWLLIDGGEVQGDRIEAMVRVFFKIHFWDQIQGDIIGFQGVAFMLYDFAINAGLRTSIKVAQRIVGAKPDGILGNETISKMAAYVTNEKEEKLFMAEFSLAKMTHYKNICLKDNRRRDDHINSNLKFLCGWINRIEAGYNV